MSKIDFGISDILIDLGCGDGRVLFHAAFMGCKKAIGIELNQELAVSVEQQIKELALEERVYVKCEDFLTSDLSEATVIYIYLLPEAILKLRSKLESVFIQNTARVIISLHFPIPWWHGEEYMNYYIYLSQ